MSPEILRLVLNRAAFIWQHYPQAGPYWALHRALLTLGLEEGNA